MGKEGLTSTKTVYVVLEWPHMHIKNLKDIHERDKV